MELYIGTKSEEENIEIFETLFERKESIEDVFGEPLTWERLEDKRACRIKKRVSDHGLTDEDNWGDTQDELVDAMYRLYNALDSHIANI